MLNTKIQSFLEIVYVNVFKTSVNNSNWKKNVEKITSQFFGCKSRFTWLLSPSGRRSGRYRNPWGQSNSYPMLWIQFIALKVDLKTVPSEFKSSTVAVPHLPHVVNSKSFCSQANVEELELSQSRRLLHQWRCCVLCRFFVFINVIGAWAYSGHVHQRWSAMRCRWSCWCSHVHRR